MEPDDDVLAAVEKLRAEARENETVVDVVDRLLTTKEFFEGKEFDTVVDCTGFLARAIRNEELPFDPTDMDTPDRERWLHDIRRTRRLLDRHGPYDLDVDGEA